MKTRTLDKPAAGEAQRLGRKAQLQAANEPQKEQWQLLSALWELQKTPSALDCSFENEHGLDRHRIATAREGVERWIPDRCAVNALSSVRSVAVLRFFFNGAATSSEVVTSSPSVASVEDVSSLEVLTSSSTTEDGRSWNLKGCYRMCR